MGEDLPAILEREPGNPHDSNAIKVMSGGSHIGYIPKEIAADLAVTMDSGVYNVFCSDMVINVKPENPDMPGARLDISVLPKPRDQCAV
jgi:hypothetical protein